MNEARLAERVARESYGRLLALLTARTRDVAAAEDALSEAFAAALSVWPRVGAPEKPEAWLFAAAKRRLIDAARRAKTAAEGESQLIMGVEEMEAVMAEPRLPDHRLGLLFACAHPAIEENARTPLMLQTVLGLSAERIAAAFLIEPAAMGQRLVRAKKRLKDADIPFGVPDAEEWPERLAAVLDAIYAAYGVGWSDPLGADPERRALADESVWLGRVLASQLPEEPEALGLLALMLHLDARAPARRDGEGHYVPLDEQDISRWRGERIAEAEHVLRDASRFGRPGRYQYEAAIQSAHCVRAARGAADWDAIVVLYAALAEMTGSPVAQLNHVAALAHRDGAETALDTLGRVIALYPVLADYQPYWALCADLHAKLGQREAARAAYGEAIAREGDASIVAFLQERRARLG